MMDGLQSYPDLAFFMRQTMAQITCVFAGVIALLQLGLYWNSRSDTQYGWTFVAAAGYAVVSLSFLMPAMEADSQAAWRILVLCGIQAFAVGGCVYFLNECGATTRLYLGGTSAWFVLLLASDLVVYIATGETLSDQYLRVWNWGLSLASLYPAWPLLRLIQRQRHWQHVIFLLTYLAVGGAAFVDTSRMFAGVEAAAMVPLLPGVAAFWFLAVCFFLVNDFSGSLRAQRQYTAQLSKELAEQKKELTRLHALERATQKAQAAALERSRIMQDMHDGLGSQLISSLAMARAGELTSAQTFELLRSCIDDLRLAIDSAQDGEDSLLTALGNLRFRMQPRLKAAGVALHWKTQTLSNPLPLRPQHQLPVLRIIQESLTNALKHANATTLTVEAYNTDTELTVSIQDDGQGFDVLAATARASGKGLNSLHKRARVLGAQLHISSSAQGTCVQLVLPLAQPQP